MKNPIYQIKIFFKKAESLEIKNCTEYGTTVSGSHFYYVEAKKITGDSLTSEIKFVNIEKIESISILKIEKFRSGKEKIEFIKAGGLEE